MPELLRHAKARNVRLWVWVPWTSVDRQIDDAFPLFERWGIAGVKIDFMGRDDQIMVDWYHRVLKQATAHHLMIDFHGAYKPDGIERTYPNLMTREAVMGLEYLKWSARVTPVHDCTLPFTRMLAGPMDSTPGGFLNVTREAFVPRNRQPMVMGTRRTNSHCSWCSRVTSRWSPTVRSGIAGRRTSRSSARRLRAGTRRAY